MLNFDRYHATMANFSLSRHANLPSGRLAEFVATFYVTQRKLPYAPCVGHERLKRALRGPELDVPHLRFLKNDKADLSALVEKLSSASHHSFDIRAVKPGTIMFKGEPLADITGPFWFTQMQEVKFEHAFDEPMTIAGRAVKMRQAAGSRHLSLFTLRRDGSAERSLEVNKYGFVGGFDDTSFMEAAYQLDINAMGTMAHYLVAAFRQDGERLEKDRQGRRKHFEQTAFERMLDAHPKGTTLLLDTISLQHGIIHAIRAAKSSPVRCRALKAVRIDSGDLAKNTLWIRAVLDANDMQDVEIIVTSDLDAGKIKEITEACPRVYGFGVGTKMIAEVEAVAGIIFKLSQIDNRMTMKLSGTVGKETLPGKTQVWRLVDKEGFYLEDIIALDREDVVSPSGSVSLVPLLQPFFGTDYPDPQIPSIHDQRKFVKEQLERFRDIEDYPVGLSPALQRAVNDLRVRLSEDEMGESGVILPDYPR